MVFAAKPDVCLPEFLPFFLQSEGFFERAHGDLGRLAVTDDPLEDAGRVGVPLPPLDEQRRIAEILWAAEEAIEQLCGKCNLLASAKSAGIFADRSRFDDRSSVCRSASLLGNIVTGAAIGQVDLQQTARYAQMDTIAFR